MIYTDLAVECAAMLNQSPAQPLPGITSQEEYGPKDIRITRITIHTAEAAKRMHKPCGNYITIESQAMLKEEKESTSVICHAISEELSKLLPSHTPLKVLVAGIGNEKITPDALGPHTISKVKITRHLFELNHEQRKDHSAMVSAIAPGVMAQTGMETAEILKRLVDYLKPDVVIAIDSLAARNAQRMNTTIQMTDTGISPGAGAKNQRSQLTKDTLGCPVIAIGVPTVIHCQALLNDPAAPDMIVTATNIDQVIHDFSDMISEGIDLALHSKE